MEHHNDLTAYLDTTIDQLSLDNLSRLDFDLLKQRLTDVVTRLKTDRTAGAQLSTLRDDYCGRICGMLKAIAAADRTGRSPEGVLAEIESLETMTADDLVRAYRRTAARFRDAFPNTPRHLRPATTAVHPHLYT